MPFSLGKRRVKTLGQVNQEVSSATSRANAVPRGPAARRPREAVEVLPEYLEALRYINEGVPLVIVTGGAGTGKSTFIRWLDEEFEGRSLVCAPTGIAALTIGGKTIHSMCHFPPAWIVPKDIRLSTKSPVDRAKVLILDEISMVNANLLDGVDRFLKLNRRNDDPFGGIVVVLVGDLFQLPPVVTSITRPLFMAEYSSPKFFAAHAVQKSRFEAIELKKAFRQTDQHFVDLLGNVREGNDIDDTLAALNSQVAITDEPPNGSVWLCPRHVDIDRVNQSRLARLAGPSSTYVCRVSGNFKESQFPVPGRIELRVGAQVVMAKNGKQWVNGSIGVVTKLGTDRIDVRLASTSQDVEVPMETWEQFDYQVNAESGGIERVVVGTFTQMPVVLAWAMTIHRSQGLTLDAVHLDLGAGAFETGQTYVALSRCRSLNRLSLSRPLQSGDIRVDPEARAFYNSIRD